MNRLLCLGVAAIAMALASAPALAGDPLNGERLARRWCAACHVVSEKQTGAVSEATPFPVIARRADFSERTVAFFLLDPHPRMPDMSLTRAEASDIAAYIATLK
ncbi:MAG: c-type cytochrome [Alphaproteobacteria bacterium]|nr:c-type cytochrome [Alphaproteobacteria bacterium]MCW5743140.1 c-type cytochrome [Alphaproteobacteria bacterium]